MPECARSSSSRTTTTRRPTFRAAGTRIDASGIDVFGGIALNTQVGGLNPHAVNLSLAMGGRSSGSRRSRLRSTSSTTAAHPQLKFPSLAVDLIPEEPIDVWADGELRPEVHAILEDDREADAVLASGHMPAQSIIAVFEARERPTASGG